MENFSLSDKYKYFCKMSKVGAKTSTGRLLTDFERGIYMGKAISIQENAKRYYRNKKNKLSNLNMNTRTYTDDELNSLFDNLKTDIK